MTTVADVWVSGAAVRNQESGPEYLAPVDDRPWSDQNGFHRGFASNFKIRAGKEVWFHFPIPTPTLLPGAAELWAERFSLLWETEGGCRLAWVTAHHGGVNRVELTERLAAVDGVLQPAPVSEYGPKCAMLRTDFEVRPRLRLQFGLQLSVLVQARGEEGVVRLYGAGAGFSDKA